MRAAVCLEHGPPEVVQVIELPVPTAAAGQVLVRVSVAAVNFPDVLLVADRYQVSVPAPFVPGSEFSGVITQVGSGVTDFAVGDRVTGTTMFGAFAEQTCVPTAALARIPEDIDDRTAAASGVAFRTAYHCLRSMALVSAGDVVVVLGAGGGVGLASVALATALGARVIAVASSDEKLDAASRYGAAVSINYRDENLRSALKQALPTGADAVVDPVGGDLSEPALRALSRGGRFVTVGYASGDIPSIPLNLVLIKGIQVLGFQFQDVPAAEFTRNEHELRELLSSGAVRPHIGAEFALTDTAAALRMVADGKAIGKVLISP
ncbi:NADPH2:quinone reductase [Mycobacterium sp. MAA66]|uniref:NADPH:quinone oxidoreductase family protein n=1 Tax=Mycobacterium sp. MAA66 TaxID=3156297 RepID=UPI003513D066